MINLNKKPRQKIGSQNGLNIYSRLKTKTKLKTTKKIKVISKKQIIKNKTWHEVELICLKRANHTCEAKKEGCQGKQFLQGHHIIFRSKSGKNTIENCLIVCQNCHDILHGIKG
jgi:5-methylcytosine-specific restriction endonuclease McrA